METLVKDSICYVSWQVEKKDLFLLMLFARDIEKVFDKTIKFDYPIITTYFGIN